MTRLGIYNTFFFLLMLAVFCGIGKLLYPFAGALLTALTCAVAFYPLYQSLHRWFPNLSASGRAAIADLVVLIFIVTPIVGLTWAVMQESNSLVPVLKQGNTAVAQLRQGDVTESFPYIRPVRQFLGQSFGMKQAEFQDRIAGWVEGFVAQISLAGSFIAHHIFIFILDTFVMLFALFFMFRDGAKFVEYIESPAPMRQENKDRLTAKIHDTVIGLFRGLLLTAILQGAVAGIGYFLIGIDAAILLGVLTAFLGLVPMVGTLGIWVPVGIAFLLQGAYFKGIFILIWGAVLVVGVMDTFVRPYLVGKKADLPMFAFFLGFLGGVEVWGAKGILLGPLLVAIAPVLVEIYKEQYSRRKTELDPHPHTEHRTELHPL